MFSSKWHYAKSITKRQKTSGTTTGYKNYDFEETEDKTQVSGSDSKSQKTLGSNSVKSFFFWCGSFQMQKVLVLKNDVEVAQFQSNAPRYLPLSEELWKALVKLPSVYDYAAYRQILERFGTHYLSEGSLGGSFKVVAKIDEKTEQYMSEDS